MIYGFIQQSGGTVTVYSEVGKGSTINVYLPRTVEVGQAARTERTDGAPVAGKDEAVLLVEDPDVPNPNSDSKLNDRLDPLRSLSPSLDPL